MTKSFLSAVSNKPVFAAFCMTLLSLSNSSIARPWCASKDLNVTEVTICKNSELRRLDARLAQVYGTASANNEDYGQLDWLKNRRNACNEDVDCISREYQSRIATLLERVRVNDAYNARPWCTAARLNLTESTICNSSPLRDLDAELQVAYGQARARDEDSGQLHWLRNERDSCGPNKECIARAYRDRTSVLRERMEKYRIAASTNVPSQSATKTNAIEMNSGASGKGCSDSGLNELKAVCVIAAVGEYACSSTLYDELPSGAITSAGASGVCNAATSHLVDGSIDPVCSG